MFIAPLHSTCTIAATIYINKISSLEAAVCAMAAAVVDDFLLDVFHRSSLQ